VERPSPLPVPSRRSTINSLTAPTPVFTTRLPAPNADLQVPEPPSRSPSPPTIVVPHSRGNKFTLQDREYFLKFISWRLKGDPTLTRQDLCAALAQRVGSRVFCLSSPGHLTIFEAPHHTAPSWYSYWQTKHDLPDKIFAAARGDFYGADGESDSEARESALATQRPKYHDPSTSEEDEDEDEEEQATNQTDDTDDDEPPKTWSESEMGPAGCSFTDADYYVTAKYIASFANWDEASGRERWGPFGDRVNFLNISLFW